MLAVLESLTSTDELKREQSTLPGTGGRGGAPAILARKQKLLASATPTPPEIDRLSAQRTLERYDSVANEGVVAKIDYQKAKDALRAAEIRANHAAQAATWRTTDVDAGTEDQVDPAGTPEACTLANA